MLLVMMVLLIIMVVVLLFAFLQFVSQVVISGVVAVTTPGH